MRTGDLQSLFGVSSTTIVKWIKVFEAYLSEGARKTDSKQRSFTEEDVIVLGSIAKLSAEGLGYDAIHAKLEEGFRVERPEVTNWGVDRRMVPAAALEQVIDSTDMRVELEQVKSERDKLAELLGQSNDQLRELREKYDQLQEEIKTLQRQLGLAEGELNLRRDQEKKKRWPFG